MPLIKSKAKPALRTNIREMINAGHPRDQAIAAAYATARKAGAKWAGKADGGPADEPVVATPPPDMPAAAPVPYVGDPEPAAPPPPPSQPAPSPPRQAPRQAPPLRQAMPRPQRPSPGPPLARQSPRNPTDLVRNLKMFYDHYGELRPDQQQRLMRMLGQPLDRPRGMKPEIDWDEFMQHHDLPGAMHERPMYHPPYRGAVRGGAIDKALQIARCGRQAGGAMPLMGKPGDVAAPAFQGFIHSHVPGRTDKHELDVEPGSYVVPADVVAAFGEGNSLAGSHLIKFQMGVGSDLTGGIKMPSAGHGMLPMQLHPKMLHMKPMHAHASGRHAEGGAPANGENGNVPIIAAGGEVVLPPERLIHKFGSLDRGHQIWDAIVKQERAAEIERLKTAPAPKK